ncbi:unnamed protein product [Hyaloperonospora brassicae]|uniref:SPIN90/Ldb17 leucine-rich domain-containing protein n=1 Tax=Hyaloperonospora brassicae TaxID=162125 RepID=A0AAV0V0A8_HYABA|nr:unnamed protein product [Hyaloperonospora brassicae]
MLDTSADSTETLERLAHIERQLRERSAAIDGNGSSNTDILSSTRTHEYTLSPDTARELWTVVLDVVFTPLWLRIRAADLLLVYCNHSGDCDRPLTIDTRETHKCRAIVSSTCQAMEELKATDATQAAQLFTWLGFVERVLLVAESDVWALVLQHSMYAGMLTKMLRLLSVCSTRVFAATTLCLGLFHSHEKKCGRSILVGMVLRDMKDGREHLGGALLHVINSCGCPCPVERTVHLCNALQLFGDILADETASVCVFLNDYKVLIDLVIRECTDLPQNDPTRLHYLLLLERVLDSPMYLQAQMYRKRELLELLESLLDAGAEEDSVLPRDVMDVTKRILFQYIDLLD